MIRRIITLLTLLAAISSCKAQGNNIKQNKTLERTTEKFDSWTYYTQRQGNEYVFEDYLRGKYVSLEEIMALILLNMQGNRMNYLVHTKNSIIKLRHSKKSDDTIIINLVLVFGSYTMKMAI